MRYRQSPARRVECTRSRCWVCSRSSHPPLQPELPPISDSLASPQAQYIMLCSLVVFFTPNVEPVLPDRETDDRSLRLHQGIDQLWHIEGLIRRDETASRRRDQINAGVDEKLYCRFLFDRNHLKPIGIDHTIRNIESIFADSHCHFSVMLEMEVEHGPEVEIGEDIAVDYQKRIL